MRDINDSKQHAEELANLLQGRLCLVNLINYNASPDLPYKGVEREEIEEFMQILEDSGINTTLRYSQGNDIQAACGQLASRGQTPSDLKKKSLDKKV